MLTFSIKPGIRSMIWLRAIMCSSVLSKISEASIGSPDELSITNSENSTSIFFSCFSNSGRVSPKLSAFSRTESCKLSKRSKACLTRPVFLTSCSFKSFKPRRIAAISSSIRSIWLSILSIAFLALMKRKELLKASASKM